MVTVDPTTARYTPLEALLFFQSLRTQDLTRIDFSTISDDLLALPLVKHDADFDSRRLSADALRKLYFDLVKEEARQHADNPTPDVADTTRQNGTLSPGSRKRKSPSPSVPSLEAAAKHRHLFPHLILKLYARYRQQAISAIKQEEQDIVRLEREITTIELGQSSENVAVKDGGQAQQNGIHDESPHSKEEARQQEQVSTTDPLDAAAATEEQQPDVRPRSARTSIDALVNHTPPPTNLAGNQDSALKAQSLQPEETKDRPQSSSNPQPQPPPDQDVTGSQSSAKPSPSLKQTLPHHVQNSQPQTAQSPVTNPPSQHIAASHSPSSPGRRPLPPQGMTMASPSVSQTSFAQPQRHSAPIQHHPYGSPVHGVSPVPAVPAGRGYPAPPYPNYQQQYQQYPHVPQAYVPQPHQAPYQIRPSQQGGFQLPPFQVAAQDPSKVHHQYPNPQTTPQRNQYANQMAQGAVRGGQSPYSRSSPFPPLTPQQSQRAPVDDDLTRSVVATLRKRRSTSTWKPVSNPRISIPRSPTRPTAEPMSPVRQTAENKVGTKDEASDHESIDRTKIRAASSRKPSRRHRGNSVASSVIASSTRGRTRSQSVISASAPDAPSTTTRSSRRVKNEQPSTPVEPDTNDTETPLNRTVRPRRGTIQPPPSTVRRTTPSAAAAAATRHHERERRDVVYATRNFTRLSSVILNEIAAHRHAGPFAKPVSDRDVEGYNDIIRRPQDLKSIKAAVTAGQRAVAAAAKAMAEAEGDTTTTGLLSEGVGVGGGDAQAIVLPKTPALVPPQGIVNSAQLEREVMRTFANAVMFNRGHDGIVGDARDMAEDVAVRMGEWRGIEAQRSGGQQQHGGGGGGGGLGAGMDVDDDGGVTGKRRRL